MSQQNQPDKNTGKDKDLLTEEPDNKRSEKGQNDKPEKDVNYDEQQRREKGTKYDEENRQRPEEQEEEDKTV
jgi:hypothetical protein